MPDIAELIDRYLAWLKDKIAVRHIEGVFEITTPFLDRHNDHIQIYVIPEDDYFLLSDDGDTITDLLMSGLEFTTPKRRDTLFTMLRGLGVDIRGNEILVKATEKDFPQKKHNLIQAILAVNDLFVMAQAQVISFFKEDVESFLRQNDVSFVTRIKLPGHSGYDHSFDFVIPASRDKPERILKTINNPTRDQASLLIFSWNDTKVNRPAESVAYAVLNDILKPVPPDVNNAFISYGIKPFLWSARDDSVVELTN